MTITSSMNSFTVSLSTDFSKRRRELNHRASPTVVNGECCAHKHLSDLLSL